ncbi:unnamed protein product [Cochlearia groenlandica]
MLTSNGRDIKKNEYGEVYSIPYGSKSRSSGKGCFRSFNSSLINGWFSRQVKGMSNRRQAGVEGHVR